MVLSRLAAAGSAVASGSGRAVGGVTRHRWLCTAAEDQLKGLAALRQAADDGTDDEVRFDAGERVHVP